MNNNRRNFLKLSSLAGVTVAGGGVLKSIAAEQNGHHSTSNFLETEQSTDRDR